MARFSLNGGLDDWIRKRKITHPLVVPILRNQILLLLLASSLASAFVYETLLGVWFCAGFAVSTFVLYSWASFFSRSSLGSYSREFLRTILFRFVGRLLALAAVMYVLLFLAQANPIALLTGVAVGTFTPVLTWALERGTKN